MENLLQVVSAPGKRSRDDAPQECEVDRQADHEPGVEEQAQHADRSHGADDDRRGPNGSRDDAHRRERGQREARECEGNERDADETTDLGVDPQVRERPGPAEVEWPRWAAGCRRGSRRHESCVDPRVCEQERCDREADEHVTPP
jgi:hypothetical protein